MSDLSAVYYALWEDARQCPQCLADLDAVLLIGAASNGIAVQYDCPHCGAAGTRPMMTTNPYVVVETEDFTARSVRLYPDKQAAEDGYYALWQARLLADGYPPDLVDDRGVIDTVVNDDYDSAEMVKFEIVEVTNHAD